MYCPKCKEDKPKYKFYKRKDGRYYSWCKECRTKQMAECKKSKEKLSRKLLTDAEVYPVWFSYNSKVLERNKKMIEEYKK